MNEAVQVPEFLLSDSHARSLAEPNVMLRAIVGSRIHGTTVEGSDDRDEMGICRDYALPVVSQPLPQYHVRHHAGAEAEG